MDQREHPNNEKNIRPNIVWTGMTMPVNLSFLMEGRPNVTISFALRWNAASSCSSSSLYSIEASCEILIKYGINITTGSKKEMIFLKRTGLFLGIFVNGLNKIFYAYGLSNERMPPYYAIL